METITCPFYPACDYKANGDYQIMLHMETLHPENGNESPFVVTTGSSLRGLAATDDDRARGEHQDEPYIACPHEGCGEALLLTELESHVEMHEQEGASSGDDSSSRGSSKRVKLDSDQDPKSGATFDTKLSNALRNLDEPDAHERETAEKVQHGWYESELGDRRDIGVQSHERRQRSPREERAPSPSRMDNVVAAWRNLLRMPPADRKGIPVGEILRRRLGKSELGPHAHEKQMPSWLVKLLDGDGAYETVNKLSRDGKLRKVRWCPNMTSGIVPVLEQLLYQDGATKYAYLCDSAVRHVSKLKREGGFCGYRNIQMMVSYIINAEAPGHDVFNNKIPTIFKIQDHIENAWDLGINESGRVETGGIRGTRKYIGTPDVKSLPFQTAASDLTSYKAQAMFMSLGISCDAQGLKPKRDSGVHAYELLYETVENYFMNGCRDFNDKVRCTNLPSIYFQHPGHSMTIVGFERKTNGSRNLLVFDPMFHDAQNVTKLIGEQFSARDPAKMLTAYRRGTRYLRRYHEFELLKLAIPTTPVPSRAPSRTPSVVDSSSPPTRVPLAPPPSKTTVIEDNHRDIAWSLTEEAVNTVSPLDEEVRQMVRDPQMRHCRCCCKVWESENPAIAAR